MFQFQNYDLFAANVATFIGAFIWYVQISRRRLRNVL